MKISHSIFDSENPVNDSFMPWLSGTETLSYAVSTGIPGVVIDFLQQGADVNAGNAYGRRPLHIAVGYGIKYIVSVLLDHGADPLAKDCEGKTPLLEAASSGRVDLTELLYYNTDVKSLHKIEDSGSTILHSLAMKSPSHIFSTLIELMNSEQGRNSLYQQFDVNHRDVVGCTLLHRAVVTGNTPVINLLLSKGADINAGDENQDTPLHFAVRYDQEHAKEMLIDQGAVLTMRNAEKKTPLELSWAKKSLRWDLYQIDEALTRSRRISLGAQAECHVLKKQSDQSGPNVCLQWFFVALKHPCVSFNKLISSLH
jgi:ankyrin repeat protein